MVVVETQTVSCEINLGLYIFRFFRERRVRDRMLVGFLSTYAIGAYQHLSREFGGQIHCEVYSIHSYIITCASDRPPGFFYWGGGTSVSSANKMEHHHSTELLFKVV
jgi:hypothetical protein